MTRRPRNRILPALMLSLLTALTMGGEARAQATPNAAASPAAASSPSGTVTAAKQMPDVTILVAPLPGNQWMISMVYAKKVPKAQADARATRLVQLTGWHTGEAFFTDRALEGGGPLGGKAPVLSSLTFPALGNIVDLADGTINVEPFLLAFRDLNRVHLTVLNPGPFTFRGLREHHDVNVDITLNAGQGAWTYIANIKNHRAERFNLPRYHQEAPRETVSGKGGGSMSKPFLLGGLIVLALGVGGAAFVLVRRLMTG
jgi:hypothetical protein